MVGPSATWNTKRVFITYRNVLSGLMEAGSWTAKINVRVTNTLTDGVRQVFRQGNVGSGTLNVTEGLPSLSIELPIVNDPQNSPNGGEITLIVTFASGGSETFKLSPLLSWPDEGTDLALILDPQIVVSAPPYNIKGIPGGVAALDAQGYVLDAFGERVVGGGGVADAITWDNITDKPLVMAVGDTQEESRNAIAVLSTSEVNAQISALINDASTLTTKVFSASKVNALVGAKASINDSVASTSTAYSSTKTDAVVSALINDAVTVTGKTWSSSKIQTIVDSAVAALVGSAPGTLDTLQELAAALAADDADINAINTALGNRVRFDAAQTLTSGQKSQAKTNIDALGTLEIGNPDTDFAAIYNLAKE